MEITLGALEAAGFAGLGAVTADAAAVTVAAYSGAVAGCMIGAGVTSVADLLAQNDVSPEVRAEIITQRTTLAYRRKKRLRSREAQDEKTDDRDREGGSD
jgi:hypothetical protein